MRLEQAARQALAAFEYMEYDGKCVTALREALAEQAEQVTEGNGSEVSSKTEAQEPVAWMNEVNGFICKEKTRNYHVPLYAAPFRTKDLTDDEIKQASLLAGLQNHYMGFHSSFLRFARAVIAADREKNRG